MARFRDSIASLIRSSVGFLAFSRDGTPSYTVERALENSTVLSCIQIVAQGISEVEFRAPEKKRLDSVLQSPNEWQTSSDFFMSIAFDVLTYNHSKVRITRNTKGDVVRLAPYSADEIRTEATAGGMPVFLDTRTGERIPDKEIIVFRDISLPVISDVSRLSALWDQIRALDAANKLMLDTFNNGLSTSFVAKGTMSVAPSKKDEWREELKELFGPGGRERGGVAVLDEGLTLEKAPMLKPADADLRALRENLIREIGAAFGVPSFLIGGSSQVAYSNTSSRMAAMYRQTFSPLINSFVRAMEKKFGTEIRANPEVLLRGDLSTLSKDARELKMAGIITANEARKRIGEQPVDAETNPDADKLVCSAPSGAEAANENRGDRTGEFPSDDGTIGNPTPDDS